MRRVICLTLALLLTGCGEVYRDMDTEIASKADFDPTRYMGLWYEIARFPVSFERGCEGVTAEYALLDQRRISVTNTCRDGAVDGPVRTAEGTATIFGPGRLKVRFRSVPFINADYWVLWVDTDYRTAVVGVPSGKAGWILSRTPDIRADHLKVAQEVLEFNGYDVSRLRYVRQPPA